MWQDMGVVISEEESEQFIKEFDADGSGDIDALEWEHMILTLLEARQKKKI